MDDVMTMIKARRSAGKMRLDKLPSRAQIEQLLEAATWAPNHKLTNPWRFFVLTGAALVAMGEMYKRLILEDASEQTAEVATRANIAAKKPTRAPVTIMVASPNEGSERQRKEDYAACAAGIENMMLLAPDLGLVTKWNTGGVIDDPRFKQHFGLPPTAEVVGLIYVGYADGTPPTAPPRKSVGELTQWLGWPE